MTLRTTPFALLGALLITTAPLPMMAQTTTEETTAETEADATETAPEIAYDAETVVKTVNGIDITLGRLIAMRQNLPAEYQNFPAEVLMTALSDQITTQVLLEKAARESGLADRPDVALSLQAQTSAVLADAYLRDELAKRVTETNVEEVYQERYVNAPAEEEVKAAHILVEDKALADQIKAELDGGASFAELAAQHGTDGTAQRGGDLGWFVHSDMVPAFADAAFAMEPGQISDPVESNFGWHLIQLEERRDRAVPEMNEVAGQIVQELTGEAQEAIMADLRAGLVETTAEPAPPAGAINEDALLAPPVTE
ncbi:MAG: peptidylprolyl isomerase [Pseudomonadota bacterium]